MLTLSKQFGTIFDILKEAKSIAKLTQHSVEFEFNGVIVNVAANYLSEASPSAEASKIMHAVRTSQQRVYL